MLSGGGTGFTDDGLVRTTVNVVLRRRSTLTMSREELDEDGEGCLEDLVSTSVSISLPTECTNRL
jgi:hypothetical protein